MNKLHAYRIVVQKFLCSCSSLISLRNFPVRGGPVSLKSEDSGVRCDARNGICKMISKTNTSIYYADEYHRHLPTYLGS